MGAASPAHSSPMVAAGRCAGGFQPPSQFAKVVARRRQGGILQLPCSLGFRLAFSATGGARLRPPGPLLKSGGKLAGKLFGFSNGICRPAAHRERRASFVGRFSGRKKVSEWFPWTEENPSVPGGAAAGAKRPERAAARAAALLFGGRGGPAGRPGLPNAAAPPGTLGFSPTPKKGRATAWLWVIPAPPAAKETVVAARAVAGQPCPNNSNPLVAGPSPPG